jgi:phage terminase Nu1 subunit (DNA packaging protein)
MTSNQAVGAVSDADLIPIAEAAELLMLTPERIRGLARDGYIAKGERGVVSRRAAVQGYIRFLKDEERRTSKVASLSKVQEARAREIELRIARESGNLIELEDMETTVAAILGALRSELAGVPAACTRDLALREIIDRHLNDAISRARDRIRVYGEGLRSGRNRPLDDQAPIPG